MAAKLSAPVDVQIELTQACNWRCRHCYNYWRSHTAILESNQNLSRDRLLYIIKELRTNQVPSITITGGEPFLQRKNLFALLRMTKGADIHTTINTNLSLVKNKDIDKLSSEYKDVSILFSLLSADEKEHEHLANAPIGTYARVLKNATLAVRKGLAVSLNMVLMRENLHAIEKTARLAKHLDVRTFCATKALPNTHTPDGTFLLSAKEVRWSLAELMRLERLLDMPVDILGCYPRCLIANTEAYQRFSHRTCVAGYTTATIGANGNVRACSHMETGYGNVFSEPLNKIWQKMIGWREGEFLPEECRNCQIVTACRGGCRVNTLAPGFHNLDIYANPKRLKKISREKLIPCLPKKTYRIPTRVIMCPQVKFRDETFGALIYKTNPLAMVLLNHSATTFLRKTAEKKETFSLTTFIKQSGAKTEDEYKNVEYLYQKLIQKGFLTTPVKKKKGGDNNGNKRSQ